MLCRCGIEVDAHAMRQDEKKPAVVVRCKGCGRRLHIRGPNACSHDLPTCALFDRVCSHGLFCLHMDMLQTVSG